MDSLTLPPCGHSTRHRDVGIASLAVFARAESGTTTIDADRLRARSLAIARSAF